jgi:hypothetical protein
VLQLFELQRQRKRFQAKIRPVDLQNRRPSNVRQDDAVDGFNRFSIDRV